MGLRPPHPAKKKSSKLVIIHHVLSGLERNRAARGIYETSKQSEIWGKLSIKFKMK